MHVAMVAGVIIVAFTGCLAPATVQDLQEDATEFRSEGAFEAVLAKGAELARANEDPSVPGTTFASLPMQAADLDALWGEDRYRLRSIHWWGPPGPPPAPTQPEERIPAVTMDASNWQGFLVAPGQMQAIPGAVEHDVVRGLADAFLRNVTRLSAQERDAVVADLLAACDVLGCTTRQVAAVDGSIAWETVGGLQAVTQQSLHPTTGRMASGSWWFDFAFDAASLEDRSGEGGTTVTVGSNDVVRFEWHSRRQHGDEESYAKMADALAEAGIAMPDQQGLTWTHQDAEAD